MDNYSYAAPEYTMPIPNNMSPLASPIGDFTYTSSQSGNSTYGAASWQQGIYPAEPPQYQVSEYQNYESLGFHPPPIRPPPSIPPLRSNEAIAEPRVENTLLQSQGFASASGNNQTGTDNNGEGVDTESTIKH